MKKLFFLILGLLIMTLCDAQSEPFDEIEVSSVHIISPSNDSISPLQTTIDSINKFIGKPDISYLQYDEYNSEDMLHYEYDNGLKIIFKDQQIESFQISSSVYELTLGDITIRIGDNIKSEVSSKFPNSWANNTYDYTSIRNGTKYPEKVTSINLCFYKNGVKKITSYFINVHWNSRSKAITELSLVYQD